jgi:hypothetical protein
MNATGAQQKRTGSADTLLASDKAPASVPESITPEAYRYAVHEIAKRAGVPEEFYKRWRFEIEHRTTTIYVEGFGKKKIVFPVQSVSDELTASIVKGQTSRATWAYPPADELHHSIPEFVVPFVGNQASDDVAPIFAASDPETIHFNFDLPAAALLTLTRVEETLSTERDAHGRFPASASNALKENYLHRPIVDEYGFALEQALRILVPQWSPERKPFRVKLSHDMDELGIPFLLRSSVAHSLLRRNPKATFQDFLSLVTQQNPVYLQVVLQLAELSVEHGLDSAFYWKANGATKFDSGYDPENAKIKSVIRSLKENGFECGVHPGYDTFRSPEKLCAEIKRLRQSIGPDRMGGRQHYLRWLPETWRDWETCGLAYDSSVGFADRIGFRAGTCVPYRPWLWAENREARILEIPLLVMDRTLAYYMKLSPQESFLRVMECMERCRAVGGVFTMLWHNEALIDPAYGDLYLRLLRELANSARFDWTS